MLFLGTLFGTLFGALFRHTFRRIHRPQQVDAQFRSRTSLTGRLSRHAGSPKKTKMGARAPRATIFSPAACLAHAPATHTGQQSMKIGARALRAPIFEPTAGPSRTPQQHIQGSSVRKWVRSPRSPTAALAHAPPTHKGQQSAKMGAQIAQWRLQDNGTE